MRQTNKNHNTIVAFLLENPQDPQWTKFAYKLKEIYTAFLESQGFVKKPILLQEPSQVSKLSESPVLLLDWRKRAYLTSIYLPSGSAPLGWEGQTYSTKPTTDTNDSYTKNQVYYFSGTPHWPLTSWPKPWLLGGKLFSPKKLMAQGPEALLSQARAYIASHRPALFLDRDGVIIEDTGYPHKPEDFRPKPEIIPVIRWARDRGYHVFVLTNQAGLARGVFSWQEYRTFADTVRRWLADAQALPDAWGFCPYHPKGVIPPWTGESLLRKPHAGMALRLSKNFAVDWGRSLMIGDKASDILEGLPLMSILLESKYLSGSSSPEGARVFGGLDEVWEFLQEKSKWE